MEAEKKLRKLYELQAQGTDEFRTFMEKKGRGRYTPGLYESGFQNTRVPLYKRSPNKFSALLKRIEKATRSLDDDDSERALAALEDDIKISISQAVDNKDAAKELSDGLRNANQEVRAAFFKKGDCKFGTRPLCGNDVESIMKAYRANCEWQNLLKFKKKISKLPSFRIRGGPLGRQWIGYVRTFDVRNLLCVDLNTDMVDLDDDVIFDMLKEFLLSSIRLKKHESGAEVVQRILDIDRIEPLHIIVQCGALQAALYHENLRVLRVLFKVPGVRIELTYVIHECTVRTLRYVLDIEHYEHSDNFPTSDDVRNATIYIASNFSRDIPESDAIKLDAMFEMLINFQTHEGYNLDIETRRLILLSAIRNGQESMVWMLFYDENRQRDVLDGNDALHVLGTAVRYGFPKVVEVICRVISMSKHMVTEEQMKEQIRFAIHLCLYNQYNATTDEVRSSFYNIFDILVNLSNHFGLYDVVKDKIRYLFHDRDHGYLHASMRRHIRDAHAGLLV
jgi:hypothetical protein